MSASEHKKEAPSSVRCFIITVSDTRTFTTDKSGQLIVSMLTDSGHVVSDRIIVKDVQEDIKNAIQAAVNMNEVDTVLLNGGTGIARRDVTYEVVQGLLEKELSGFGELFRMISYTDDIGTPAMLSRAIGGVVRDTAVFAMPGSSGAVKLAMSRLLLPELPHIIRELTK